MTAVAHKSAALVIAAGAVLTVPGLGYAQAGLSDALSECAAVSDDTERLACFDALAADAEPAAAARAPAASEAPPAASAPPRAPAPITDDVGLAADEDDEPEYSVRVTSCREAARGQQLFFYLDNGQVWKQSDYRRLRMRDCDFDAVIVKGAFGFRLELADIDRTVRVSRVR